MPTDSTVDQLLAAAGCGDLNEVGLILRNYPNMDINCGDRCKSSALHYAAEKGHIDVVSLLIKKGAIVNVRNMWEKTPLHSASNHGHLEIVKLLIDNGARIEATSNKKRFTPMHLASQYNHLSVVEYLVESGADVTAQAEVRMIFIMNVVISIHTKTKY